MKTQILCKCGKEPKILIDSSGELICFDCFHERWDEEERVKQIMEYHAKNAAKEVEETFFLDEADFDPELIEKIKKIKPPTTKGGKIITFSK